MGLGLSRTLGVRPVASQRWEATLIRAPLFDPSNNVILLTPLLGSDLEAVLGEERGRLGPELRFRRPGYPRR